MWEAAAGVMHGWVRAQAGQAAPGAAAIVSSLADYRATGAGRYQHFFLALLSEAHLLGGHLEAALVTLGQGIGEVCRTGERFYEAELHRLRGEALAQLSPERATEAESSLRRAVVVAQEHEAVLLQRRAMSSLEAFRRPSGPAVGVLVGSG